MDSLEKIEYRRECRNEVKKEIEQKFACYLNIGEHKEEPACKLCSKKELLVYILNMLS